MTSRFRSYLRELLRVDEPPHLTALAYGLGVFIGFSPFYGFHTISGLAIILLFRVNRLAILAGVYTNTPWTIAPAATLGTALGLRLLGAEAELPRLSSDTIFSSDFYRELLADVPHLVLPFVVGNLVLATILATIATLVCRRLLIRYRRRRESDSVSTR